LTAELLSRFVGHTSAEYLVDLLPAVGARTVTLIHYKPTITLAKRNEPSLMFQNDRWIPDYEILFAQRLATGVVPHDLVDAALEHRGNPVDRKRIKVPVDEFSLERIALIRSERPGWALALSSSVDTDLGERHLPMMDFQCPVADIYRDVVCTAMAKVMPLPGVVVESGLSYHYFGASLTTVEEWLTFLGRCLLLSPFTDTRYIGHRLIDRECVLRIAPDDVKPAMPRVIAVVTP